MLLQLLFSPSAQCVMGAVGGTYSFGCLVLALVLAWRNYHS